MYVGLFGHLSWKISSCFEFVIVVSWIWYCWYGCIRKEHNHDEGLGVVQSTHFFQIHWITITLSNDFFVVPNCFIKIFTWDHLVDSCENFINFWSCLWFRNSNHIKRERIKHKQYWKWIIINWKWAVLKEYFLECIKVDISNLLKLEPMCWFLVEQHSCLKRFDWY